ncbi:rhamnan synthesis F family protein [Reyranella sp. CPCC 100927]|uniref:rhamnosyltransferase WsaF family glycosyltransferase n=1 Tax=Reyranella sp. CPCC 100927 TaxID=2599616 RepID=UPI0011B5EFD8|nr:rhamnan synthesis F family protein [Reyranella sp. CPCC 100927]TWT12895.1 hypothetical protein FQU96_11665 [Reyranella sp. CPCC 100927]
MKEFFDIDLGYVGLHGAIPSSRVRHIHDPVLSVPFPFSREVKLRSCTIGVFAHIFDVEAAEEIARYLGNIPVSFDVWATTSSDSKADVIRNLFRSVPHGKLEVRVVENRGRDLAGFLVGCADKITLYDHVLHVHSKHSKHDSDLAGWRTYLFDHLLGSPEIVTSNLLVLQNSDVGLLFPDHFKPVRRVLNFGGNYSHMRHLLKRMGVQYSKDILLEFPSGSMFWANSAALKPIMDLKLTLADFPPEAGQIDGEIQHAIERSLVYAAEISGKTWTRVVRPGDCEIKRRLITVNQPKDIQPAAQRSTRRLLGNRMALGSKVEYFPEINRTGFRPDFSEKPRLTLLTPTLRPDKLFGGVATSLKVFRDIQEEMPDVQVRIVSLTDTIDQECMRLIPDHVLTWMDAYNSEAKFDAVDLGDNRQLNQLSIRRNEVFMATAWWTARFAIRAQLQQRNFFGSERPFIYLIQDHEPDFYGWSSRYALAKSTYHAPNMIGIVNSEELSNYFDANYSIEEKYCLPYSISTSVRAHFKTTALKERIILIYGRPDTPRNAFELLMDGICLWQQEDVEIAKKWRIVSAGTKFEHSAAPHVQNLTIHGKLSLQDYGEILSRSAVGISLMLSPHPSYPPLEMAEAGAITITNSYQFKDLRQRSPNIVSMDAVTPESLAQCLGEAVRRGEERIGKTTEFLPVRSIATGVPEFDAAKIAQRLGRFPS